MSGLRLRAMEMEDVDLMYRVENDASLWHLGSASVPYSHALLRDFVLNTTGDIYTDKQVRLMVEDDEGQVVGMVDLTDFSVKHSRAQVGIIILEPFRGMGYATEAIRLVVSYASDVLHLNQLYAYIETDNVNCLTAFRSNGFQTVVTINQWIRVAEGYRDVLMLQFFLKK